MQMMFIRVFLPTQVVYRSISFSLLAGNVEGEIDFFRNFLGEARHKFNTEDSSNYLDVKTKRRIFSTQHVL